MFDFIYTVVGYPLGWVMWFLYKIVGNYALALLIFTILARLVMIPSSIKTQQTSVKMALLQPQIEELRKKYANNPQKLQQETMAVYEKQGYSPYSGCLPLLIQFPILFGLIDVVYKPLTHIIRFSAEVIDRAVQLAGIDLAGGGYSRMNAQLTVIKEVRADPARFAELGADFVEKVQGLNLTFFGLDLTAVPTIALNALIVIPILSGLTSLLLSFMSMRNTSSAGNAAGGASMKAMMLIMPVFSVMISLQVPAGVGLYWIYSNVIGFIQSTLLFKFYNPKEMAEKARAEFEAKQEEERQRRIEARRLARERGENPDKALSQKEANRRRLAEARRRDAEKYGEAYEEVTDDDLK